jgi:putative ABC transport system permease protein
MTILDLRYALRRLRHARGYTASAILTLGLAIGATTAIFSAVQAVLLKPMPIREPDRLVVAWGVTPERDAGVIELSYLDVQDLANATPDVGDVASMSASAWPAVLDGEGEPRKLATAGVSGRFFEVLGTTPFMGRLLRPEDDVPNAAKVVVIGHALWAGQFGSDPRIVGRRIRLDEEPVEIVGVAQPGFDYPWNSELWQPVHPILAASSAVWKTDALRNVGVLFMLARLGPGLTPATAAEQWTHARARLQSASPAFTYELVATPFLEHQIGPARQAIWILFCAAGVLLLIACANVSGLMLTRVALHHREDAVRLALGASRSAVGRQWAIESLLLAAVGGTVGLLFSRGLVDAIIALAPAGIPRLDEVAINVPVAVFTFVVIAVVSLLCGAAPVRQTGAVSLASTLSDSSRTIAGARSYRARSALLVFQIAMSVVLLIAAALVVRSFGELQRVDLGFTADSVLTLRVEPRVENPPINDWIRDLLARVAALPPVESAGAVSLLPLELGAIGQGTWVLLEHQPDTPEATRQNPILNYQVATPGYFRAMNIPLKRGRLFEETDVAAAPRVAIISERTAAVLFPGADPIGRRLRLPVFSRGDGPKSALRTVVGVVSDVRYRGISEVLPDIYEPAAQTKHHATSLAVRIRPDSGLNPVAVAAAIQRDARELDPRVLVSRITTLESVVASAMAPWRFSAWVFALFAVLACLLAAVGLFSLVSLDVTSRRQEFAVRSAMGASGGVIVRGVMASAGSRAGIGIAAGFAVALGATQVLSGLLHGVGSRDPATYAAVLALVILVVGVAAYLPARRAAICDPSVLLR